MIYALLLYLAVQPDKPAPAPAALVEVEAHCADGSTVRVTLLQPSLKVETKYGPLVVPLAEVRKIELGLHFPEGMAQRVQVAVQRLGSTSQRERDSAVAELLALGEYAYPAAHAATKSGDLEVAQRAEKVVTLLKERLPAARLRLDPRDRIETAEGTFVGRLTGPALKARHPYFGDVELHFCHVRTLRRLGGAGNAELTVDAAKYGSPGSPWLDTGIEVAARRLLLEASGTVDLWPASPGQYTTGAGGFRNAGAVYHAGTLLGRIGEHGKIFAIGERWEGTPEQEGRLFLAITPSPWNNASAGSYRVSVREP